MKLSRQVPLALLLTGVMLAGCGGASSAPSSAPAATASVRATGPSRRPGLVRALGPPGSLLQLGRLLACPGSPRGLPGAREGKVVRHRLADLLARCVVRGSPRRRVADRGDRYRRPARIRSG